MKRIFYISSLICMLIAIALSNFMFGAVAILLSAAAGGWAFALFCGMVLDALFGVPSGALSIIAFPFTCLALCATLVRISASRFFIHRGRGAYL